MSLASLAGLYLIRLLGAALHVAGLSAVALSTAGTLLCFLLPALAGLFLLDGDQRGLIALRALSAQHVLCLAAAGRCSSARRRFGRASGRGAPALRRGNGAGGGRNAGFSAVSTDAAAKRAARADLRGAVLPRLPDGGVRQGGAGQGDCGGGAAVRGGARR
ncbi:MAG: hypothetical protein ACLUHE_04060 [Christensenellales bacterium]